MKTRERLQSGTPGIGRDLFAQLLNGSFLSTMSFVQVMSVFDTAQFEAELAEKLINQMAQVAKTLGDWIDVYLRAPKGSNVEMDAAKKILEFAKTPAALLEVYAFAPLSTLLRTEVESRLRAP